MFRHVSPLKNCPCGWCFSRQFSPSNQPATKQSTSCSCSSCNGRNSCSFWGIGQQKYQWDILMVCRSWWKKKTQKLGSWGMAQPSLHYQKKWDLASFGVRLLQEPTSETSTCAKSCLSGVELCRPPQTWIKDDSEQTWIIQWWLVLLSTIFARKIWKLWRSEILQNHCVFQCTDCGRPKL